MTHPVFIVGEGTTLPSLTRQFSRAGIPCWTLASSRTIGTVTRRARFVRIPDPREDEDGMIEAVLDLARQQPEKPVVFTGLDQHAQALARHHVRLCEVAIPCLANTDIVELLVDKGRFSTWAERHVASYPLSVLAAEFRPGRSMAFPVIAKPAFRGFANSAALNLPSEKELVERRFTLIETPEAWRIYEAEQARYLPYLLVQEFVRGNASSKYSLGLYADSQSEIRALFVGRRLRGFPPLYGDATLVQSDVVPESIVAEVHHVVKELGYTGIAEFEYNRDELTGAFRLLEINARCWGWIGMTAATPCDVAGIAYRDLTGQTVDAMVRSPEPGSVKMVFLLQDLLDVFCRYRSHYPQWVLSPRAWWHSVRADRLVIWELDRHDVLGSIWCLWRTSFRLSKAVAGPRIRPLLAIIRNCISGRKGEG